MQQPTAGRSKGGRRSKKLSTRIDLTPMVDLGFLLITFFIFTTTLGQPKIMGLVMPDEKPTKDPSKIEESNVMQVILAANNKVMYYYGEDVAHAVTTHYGSEGLRAAILQKQQGLRAAHKEPKELMLLIKPTDASSYQNFIAVMDEIAINRVEKYALMPVTEADNHAILAKH